MQRSSCRKPGTSRMTGIGPVPLPPDKASCLLALCAPCQLHLPDAARCCASLRTTLCVQMRGEAIACGIIFMAARRLQVRPRRPACPFAAALPAPALLTSWSDAPAMLAAVLRSSAVTIRSEKASCWQQNPRAQSSCCAAGGSAGRPTLVGAV